MISIIKAPGQNKVLLDANNTEIIIQSTHGDGYYFRALIYVNDILFDEQGWSRIDNKTASKDLVKLYSAYYETILSLYKENGVVEQKHLIKKIKITIQEKSHFTDTIVDTLDLPIFYFMFNINPVSFDDNIKVDILGVLPPVMRVPENGKIMIPFYIKSDNENVYIQLKDNFGNVLDEQSTGSFFGKKVFFYSFDLTNINLVKDTLYFELNIVCGIKKVTKMYRLIRFPNFTVKEIYFKNNFGFYIPVYFDGELEIQNSLKINDFKKSDGSNETYEINEDATYTINTGSLLIDEKLIVNQIVNSHEVLLKVDGEWVKIQSSTKKVLEYRDKKHLYAQDLTFSFVKNGRISNYKNNIAGSDWNKKDFSSVDWLT